MDTHTFEVPQRKVTNILDIKTWEQSEAYQSITGILISLNESVKGKRINSPCHESEAVKQLLEVFPILHSWVDEIPPIDQPQRFGNKAFRDFYTRLRDEGTSLLSNHMDTKFEPALKEIAPYFIESFGNATRIDYGTGHELAFIMFLCCLFELGVLIKEDSVASVTRIFKRYLDFTRRLQIVYKMEPAGSQGVWSLDDYQFIPFYWGSSQLFGNPKISPEMITNQQIVEENHEDYLFLSCIKYILQVKTGPFAEHSNQLWNISGVPSWTKINQGLMKMYKAEILNKFPIIQHVLFGSILTLKKAEMVKPSIAFGQSKTFLNKSSPPVRPLGQSTASKPVAVVHPTVATNSSQSPETSSGTTTN